MAKRLSFCDERKADSARPLRFLARAAVLSALLVHAGCSSLPTSGPSNALARMDQVDPAALPYALVKVTPDIENILERNSVRIGRVFTDRRGPAEIRFGIGDTVSVTIFEAAAGGLFIPVDAGVRPGNYVTLPNQPVDTQGNITVPYAGNIRAQGRTAVQVQTAIVNALKNRALEPQAVVALVDQKASSISVLGEVGTPSRFPANAAGERLLDAISRAGGPRNPGYDTFVSLEREGRQATAPFGSAAQRADQQHLRPAAGHDLRVHAAADLRRLRRVGTAGTIRVRRVAALDCRGFREKPAGLNDNLADPASVYLYRGERREVAQQLGVDCSRFSGAVVPVIYNLNLRDPAGYFLATKFEMHNKDVVFASNSNSVESSKLLTHP